MTKFHFFEISNEKYLATSATQLKKLKIKNLNIEVLSWQNYWRILKQWNDSKLKPEFFGSPDQYQSLAGLIIKLTELLVRDVS